MKIRQALAALAKERKALERQITNLDAAIAALVLCQSSMQGWLGGRASRRAAARQEPRPPGTIKINFDGALGGLSEVKPTRKSEVK